MRLRAQTVIRFNGMPLTIGVIQRNHPTIKLSMTSVVNERKSIYRGGLLKTRNQVKTSSSS
jgi:hypothetical protein